MRNPWVKKGIFTTPVKQRKRFNRAGGKTRMVTEKD